MEQALAEVAVEEAELAQEEADCWRRHNALWLDLQARLLFSDSCRQLLFASVCAHMLRQEPGMARCIGELLKRTHNALHCN